MSNNLLPCGMEWSFPKIQEYYSAIEDIALNDFRLNVYENQIEVITAEQMIDAYASVGLPVGYKHWSYGKEFIYNMQNYKRGRMGLAYEIVINSNPCISYLMEENNLPTQALVMAHAAFGHNAFFKNNYLFKQRTDASTIIEYMAYAQRFVQEQEEIHGIEVVEEFLDHIHAIRNQGYDHYVKPAEQSKRRREQIVKQSLEEDRKHVSEFWSTVAPTIKKEVCEDDKFKFPKEPQENLLHFFEMYSPNLEDWQRELIKINRKLQEYFYPQGQTQVGNEGFATFTHYNIIHTLNKQGRVDTEFMAEFMKLHTNVITQRDYNQRGYGGINVYTLGFNMFQDIRRMCEQPTKEDEEWFPNIVGRDWIDVTQEAAFNFRDETFIKQYLSPKVIRDMKLMATVDDTQLPYKEVVGTAEENTYKVVRNMLAQQKNRFNILPQIEIVDVDVRGDRTLTLKHTIKNGTFLDEESAVQTLKHIYHLWQFDVTLVSQTPEGDTIQTYKVEGGR